MADLDLRIQAHDAFTPTFGKLNTALSGIGQVAMAPMKALGGIVDTLGKVGLAADGIRTVASTLGNVFLGPIQGASDVGEAMNKVQVVFGDSTEGIKEFARTAATGLGQSQSTALGALGTFGNLFVSMGMATDAAADMSRQTVALASDLASFNNIRPEEALEKLRAGLVGETEPLRTLGVMLSAASVEARALEMNLGKTKDTLTATDKAAASMALIMEQTVTAQGDFARTSTGFANAQRVIKAQFDDLQATLGAAFLPTLEKVVGVVSQSLPGALGALQAPIKAAAGMFDDAAAEVLTFIETTKNISDTEGVDVFTAAITALELRIGEVFGQTAKSVFHDFVDLLSDLVAASGLVVEALKGLAEFVAGRIVGVFADGDTAGQALGGTMTALGTTVKTAATALSDFSGILDEASPRGEVLRKILDAAIVAFVTWKAVTIGAALATEVYVAVVYAAGVATSVWSVATTAAAVVSGAFTAALSGAAAAFRVLNLVIMANPIGALVTVLALLVAGLVYAYNESEAFRDVVDAVFATVSEVVMGAMTTAVQYVSEFATYVVTVGKSVYDGALAIGTAIVDGIVGGITAIRDRAVKAVNDLANALPNEVRAILGIASPSAVFAALGTDIVDGLTLGIDAAADTATGAVEDLATAIGATMPRVLTATEAEVAKHQDRLSDAIRRHERSEADALAKHLEKIGDLEADLGRAKRDERAAILEKIADERVAYQRRERDDAARHGREVEDINREHAAAMVSINERMAEQRFAALDDLMQGLQAVEVETTGALASIGERTGARINEAIVSAASAIADVSARAAEAINDASASIDLGRAIRTRREEFAEGQTEDARIRARAREDEAAAEKTREAMSASGERQARDAATLARRVANDRAALEAKALADVSALRTRREAEDADTAYKLSQDVRYARDADDVSRLQTANARLIEDRNRARGIEDKALVASTTAARKALDAKALADTTALAERQRDEVAALAAATEREVTALATRRAREDEDRAYRATQQSAAQAFADGLEDEALGRQIKRIREDTTARIGSINEALTAKQQAISKDAEEETRKIGEAATERIATLKSKFFDKVGPLTDDAKGKITTYIEDVQRRVGSLQAAAIAAAAAVASVGGGGSDSGVASGLSNALTSLVTTTQSAGREALLERKLSDRGAYAMGGRSVPGGLALVGERGPELVRLPGGADVFSNTESARMLGSGDSDAPVVINLDGVTIARSTWKHLKRLNLAGATLGLS